MKEVAEFVQVELDKLKKEFDEEFLLYLGSVIGAAYIMGFLIAREVDHKIYDGLIPFESLLSKSLGYEDIDKIIDDNIAKGKNPKEIGKIIKEYFGDSKAKKAKKASRKKPIRKKQIKEEKKPKLEINFNEEEL